MRRILNFFRAISVECEILGRAIRLAVIFTLSTLAAINFANSADSWQFYVVLGSGVVFVFVTVLLEVREMYRLATKDTQTKDSSQTLPQ